MNSISVSDDIIFFFLLLPLSTPIAYVNPFLLYLSLAHLLSFPHLPLKFISLRQKVTVVSANPTILLTPIPLEIVGTKLNLYKTLNKKNTATSSEL